MKVLVFIILSFALASTCTATEKLVLTVPPLEKELPLIESIYRIGDDVIVRTEKYASKEGKWHHFLWRLDEKKGYFIPFINDNNERIVAVSEGSLNELIASSDGKGLHLKFINQPKRNITISESEESPFRLGANAYFTFVVFAERIIEVSSKGTVRSIRLNGLIPEEWRMLPRAIAVSENELILGYDKGEWGGAVYSMRIDKNGLDAKSNRLLSENVCAIRQDSKGGIWIASGLSHLGMRDAGLHFYDGQKISGIVSQRYFFEKELKSKSGVAISLHKSTEISGMTVNSKDEVVIVAAEAGLFSYTIGNPFRSLWEGSLYITYNMTDYSVGSFPQGIVEKGKKLYVASRSLGVFCFEIFEKGKYIPTKQIVFKRSSSNKTNSADAKTRAAD